MKSFKLRTLLITILTITITITNAYATPKWIITHDVKHDTSPPLRDASAASLTSHRYHHVVPLFHLPATAYTGTVTHGPDRALQTLRPWHAPIPVTKFTGVGAGLGNYRPNSIPPDTNGAPGINQYVQWVNTDIAVFDKKTGKLAAGFPKPGNAIWKGFGGLCETTNEGDPIVKYDQLANRWVLTQFAFGDEDDSFYQCVAVSKNGDATGAYYRYAFKFNAFNDYGKLAVWPDAYYMTFNMFTRDFIGPLACALDRNAMLAGKTATMQCRQLDNEVGSLLPADLDGKTLPANKNSEYLLTFGPNQLELYKFHPDFANPSKTTFTGPTTIAVANFNVACSFQNSDCVRQPNVNERLDSLSDRLMYRLAYRQFSNYGAMVVNHTVQGPNRTAAIRWYELRVNANSSNPTVYQQGTFAPNADFRFMGSIAMDKFGNIAAGYSQASTNVYPSVTIAGRTTKDPLGTFSFEQIMTAGTGSQQESRWGDYSSMMIDPVDDCTFWYTNEYLKSTGSFNWSTIIGNFKLAGCS